MNEVRKKQEREIGKQKLKNRTCVRMFAHTNIYADKRTKIENQINLKREEKAWKKNNYRKNKRKKNGGNW